MYPLPQSGSISIIFVIKLVLILTPPTDADAQFLKRIYSSQVPPHVQIELQNYLQENPKPIQSIPTDLWIQRQIYGAGRFGLKDSILSGQLRHLRTESAQLFDDPETGFLANVSSPSCRSHMTQFLRELTWSLPTQIKPPAIWALQMIDSWGKFPDGLLSGHTSSLGDFEECLQIRGSHITKLENGGNETEHFEGRYCLTYLLPAFIAEGMEGEGEGKSVDLNPDNDLQKAAAPAEILNTMASTYLAFLLLPQFGICFPSSCSQEDAQQLLNNVDRILTNQTIIQWITACHTEKKEPLDTPAYIMIAILATILSLCVLGTLVDLLVYRKAAPNSRMRGTPVKALVAFSIYTNTLKWLNTDAGKGVNLGCLHGLRFLSMAWVVLGHSWQTMGINQSLWNTLDFISLYQGNWTIMAILNGTLSVDTFFVISGTLASFHIFRALDKSRGKLNVPLLYLHRYLRLTPTYMILVGVVATLLPYSGSGPNWQTMENEGALCRKYWWHNLLYITNLVKYPANTYSCYSESWYLSNDMQFFILAPLIIYPIWRWPKMALPFLGTLHIASIIVPTVVKATENLAPTIILTIDPGAFSEDLYNPPWTRIAPYLIGLTLGYILHLQQKQPDKNRRLQKSFVLALWLVSTLVALATIFGIQRYFDPANMEETYESTWSHIYGGTNRYVWGAVVAWIIYACINGYGGWVNDFLCWKPFIPLGRLTFCVYMSSLHLQMFFHLTTLTPWHYSVYTTVNIYFAHLVMALLVGYILTMTLESPFMQLEKLIFPESSSSSASKNQKTGDENGSKEIEQNGVQSNS